MTWGPADQSGWLPQYSNDDVVIPGLIAQGYAPEDARNYAIAACWEFIIPKKGMEIVNIDALSFAEVTPEVHFGASVGVRGVSCPSGKSLCGYPLGGQSHL